MPLKKKATRKKTARKSAKSTSAKSAKSAKSLNASSARTAARKRGRPPGSRNRVKSRIQDMAPEYAGQNFYGSRASYGRGRDIGYDDRHLMDWDQEERMGRVARESRGQRGYGGRENRADIYDDRPPRGYGRRDMSREDIEERRPYGRGRADPYYRSQGYDDGPAQRRPRYND